MTVVQTRIVGGHVNSPSSEKKIECSKELESLCPSNPLKRHKTAFVLLVQAVMQNPENNKIVLLKKSGLFAPTYTISVNDKILEIDISAFPQECIVQNLEMVFRIEPGNNAMPRHIIFSHSKSGFSDSILQLRLSYNSSSSGILIDYPGKKQFDEIMNSIKNNCYDLLTNHMKQFQDLNPGHVWLIANELIERNTEKSLDALKNLVNKPGLPVELICHIVSKLANNPSCKATMLQILSTVDTFKTGITHNSDNKIFQNNLSILKKILPLGNLVNIIDALIENKSIASLELAYHMLPTPSRDNPTTLTCDNTLEPLLIDYCNNIISKLISLKTEESITFIRVIISKYPQYLNYFNAQLQALEHLSYTSPLIEKLALNIKILIHDLKMNTPQTTMTVDYKVKNLLAQREAEREVQREAERKVQSKAQREAEINFKLKLKESVPDFVKENPDAIATFLTNCIDLFKYESILQRIEPIARQAALDLIDEFKTYITKKEQQTNVSLTAKEKEEYAIIMAKNYCKNNCPDLIYLFPKF